MSEAQQTPLQDHVQSIEQALNNGARMILEMPYASKLIPNHIALAAWNTRPAVSREEVAVKPLEIAEQYADPVIETEFGDYVMEPNNRYSPEGTEFLGMHIEQRKFHIKLGGMTVMHTDDPENFLPYVQSDFEYRIAKHILPPAPVAGNTDPMTHDDELRNAGAGWRDMDDPALEQIKKDAGDVLVNSVEGIELAWYCEGQGAWMTRDGTFVPAEPDAWMPLPPAPDDAPQHVDAVKEAPETVPLDGDYSLAFNWIMSNCTAIRRDNGDMDYSLSQMMRAFEAGRALEGGDT